MTSFQQETDAGIPPPGRRYRTLAAHPGRFRVIDAIRDFDESWWHTGGRELRAGDRVAIWKYKGAEAHRGIIAFGEALTYPAMREEPEDEQPYWIDPEGKASALRVRIRYGIKPEVPLWYESSPDHSVVRQLPESRAQGGTAHRVTDDQWAQLMNLIGGWPQPDAGEWRRRPNTEPTLTHATWTAAPSGQDVSGLQRAGSASL